MHSVFDQSALVASHMITKSTAEDKLMVVSAPETRSGKHRIVRHGLRSALVSVLLSIVVCFIPLSGTLFAQDPQFSQFYAAPLYLNPAFAGSTNQARAGI